MLTERKANNEKKRKMLHLGHARARASGKSEKELYLTKILWKVRESHQKKLFLMIGQGKWGSFLSRVSFLLYKLAFCWLIAHVSRVIIWVYIWLYLTVSLIWFMHFNFYNVNIFYTLLCFRELIRILPKIKKLSLIMLGRLMQNFLPGYQN